jgi:hypothetical protein
MKSRADARFPFEEVHKRGLGLIRLSYHSVMTSTKFGNEEFETNDKKIIQKLLEQKLPG